MEGNHAAVVADHENKDLPGDPVIVDQARRYLLDAQWLPGQRPCPRGFFDQMVATYPDKLNAARSGTARSGSSSDQSTSAQSA